APARRSAGAGAGRRGRHLARARGAGLPAATGPTCPASRAAPPSRVRASPTTCPARQWATSGRSSSRTRRPWRARSASSIDASYPRPGVAAPHGEVPPPMIRTVEWRDDALYLIDQRRLPDELVVERCAELGEVVRAIKEMRVRGAPAIGVAAAYGMALAARRSHAPTVEALKAELARAAEQLRATRPTAVNLAWAVQEVLVAVEDAPSVAAARERALGRAHAIAAADLESCHQIGANGADLIPPGSTVLTHCNAGGLATAGYGTALGVIRTAFHRGLLEEVLVDETRPVLQGARLTAWELQQDGIPATLIADGAAELHGAWARPGGRRRG